MATSSQVKKLDHVKCKHDIFLSHSGQEKPFVEQLHEDLKRVNHHPFFDQDSDCLPKAEKFAPKILEAAEQCRLGVVVVSKGYLTSKWPMLELRKFVEREVKLFPLFLNVSPHDLKETEVERKWKQSWRQLVESGEVKEEELELWSEAVKHLRSYNGLEYARFANSEYKYRSAVVDEICKRLQPSVLEWSTDRIQGFETKPGNDRFGLKYHSLSDQLKLVFLDSALYPFYGYVPLPWWSKEERTDFELWVSWLSQVHGVSPIDARMMVFELKRLSLLEGSSLKVIVNDNYKEFARDLVKKEGSKEWEWWMSREEMGSSNVTQLKRLVLHKDKSIIGCTPKKLHEWRSLIFLELKSCDDIGPDIELGGLSSLRVLSVRQCQSVRRILCSCDNGYNDQVCCHGREPGRGCMSELRFVYLRLLSSLEDISFLRHCSNLEELRISDCNEAIYPTTNVDSESHGAINLGYLKALRILSMIGGQTMPGYDVNAFIRWLLNALELENLTAFEYVILEKTWKEGVGGYTIDLNILAPLPSRLSVLSLCLPEDIEKVEGLHRLSELTTLNLNWCQGLRQLPDLRELPKLKWICVHGCCKLEASPRLESGIEEIGDLTPTGTYWISHDYWNGNLEDHKCLQPYCYQWVCLNCTKRKLDGIRRSFWGR